MSGPKQLPAYPSLSLSRQKDEPKTMMQATKVGSTNIYPVSASFGKPTDLGSISPKQRRK